MKFFADLREALKHVADGGQALHLWKARPYSCPKAPACFKGRRLWGHLLDLDKKRLVAMARALGVRVVRIHRLCEPKQHVDLCGKPLDRARRLCLGLWAQEKTMKREPIAAKTHKDIKDLGMYMRYLGCLQLLADCAVHLDEEDFRERIGMALGDARKHHPWLKWRRILNRFVIETEDEGE